MRYIVIAGAFAAGVAVGWFVGRPLTEDEARYQEETYGIPARYAGIP